MPFSSDFLGRRQFFRRFVVAERHPLCAKALIFCGPRIGKIRFLNCEWIYKIIIGVARFIGIAIKLEPIAIPPIFDRAVYRTVPPVVSPSVNHLTLIKS